MEEAAQILEIETFIPLLLQTPQDGFNRLKRWIMIGDHHQLPPVIKNMAFQKYSNMEQSLFTRVVRLGVPTIDLDAQGRARPSLCSLYQWRYKKLGNLQHVTSGPEHRVANAGFGYDFQLINVDDFQGVGESEPNPYFFQNLAEAEYVVAVFMYMRLLGYPAEKISILTTYNGQKHLIRDVVNTRCANNPLIGRPSKIDTVDKYQVRHRSINFQFPFCDRTSCVTHMSFLFGSRVNKTITFFCRSCGLEPSVIYVTSGVWWWPRRVPVSVSTSLPEPRCSPTVSSWRRPSGRSCSDLLTCDCYRTRPTGQRDCRIRKRRMFRMPWWSMICHRWSLLSTNSTARKSRPSLKILTYVFDR